MTDVMHLLNSSHRDEVAKEEMRSRADRFCVLGAGSSGLAVARSFRQFGISFDCLEQAPSIGGNWCFGQPRSSVYRSTRLISSKRLTEYSDFPMPEHFPDHPDHELVWQYLRSFSEQFDLYPSIEFNTTVKSLEPAPGSGWFVTIEGGKRRRYRGVVIANGHNWDPRWPMLPGHFNGTFLHSSEYKVPDVLAGRRVLVLGGGNSGYDIASESARHASATFHSLRRHYHVLPRYFRGRPIDTCGEWMLEWRMPLWFRRLSAARASRKVWATRNQFRLPRSDHKLFETHPVINSSWPHDVSRGQIAIKPNIRELRGTAVLFEDGSREAIDIIICATGFRITFPFLPVERLNWQHGQPDLYLNIFHPERDDLFVAGLIQPDSGQFGIVDFQSQLIAAYIAGLDAGCARAREFQAVKKTHRWRTPGAIRYVQSPRHLLEVEHSSYRRQLQRWIKRLRAAHKGNMPAALR